MRHHGGIIPLRILSFHASYACRHSGACCSAGWIEPGPGGICRHFDAHPDGGCRIHRSAGHDALPHACQQFPRVVTQSPLGTSVTLSAFCPTAASLLFDAGPFRITTIHDARVLEGLDARTVLPPLLRPGMLMDWAAVATWETLAVRTLSEHRADVDRALAIIEAASERVSEAWTPKHGPLSDALAIAFTEAAGIFAAPPGYGRAKERSRLRSFNGAASKTPASAQAMARYFAGHAFACWPMYDGKGIRGALDWLKTVRAALEDECRSLPLKDAMRQADLRLRHAASRS